MMISTMELYHGNNFVLLPILAAPQRYSLLAHGLLMRNRDSHLSTIPRNDKTVTREQSCIQEGSK